MQQKKVFIFVSIVRYLFTMSTTLLAPPPKEVEGQAKGNANPLGFLGSMLSGKGKGKKCDNGKCQKCDKHGHSHNGAGGQGAPSPAGPQMRLSPHEFQKVVSSKLEVLTPSQRDEYEENLDKLVAMSLKQLLHNESRQETHGQRYGDEAIACGAHGNGSRPPRAAAQI